MKPAAALLLLTCLVTVGAAQDPGPAADDPLLQQRRLAMVLRQSTKHYEAGEYQVALERLGSLPENMARDLSALNLRGAILTKLGRYDEARQIFDSILLTDPNYFPAAFNLGEVQFVKGDYAGALRTFQQIQRRDPRNELVRFKVLLCHLQLGEDEPAQRIASGFIPAGSTPAWYYAQAMLARRAGDQARASRHLTVARSIYEEAGCRLFDESIRNIKW